MKKFILIEVIEQDIGEPVVFDILEKAKGMMINHAKECHEAIINDMSAYGETFNHDAWDAKIFEVDI